MAGLVHVVDDDAGFRAAIGRRLKKAGYEVATYPSAKHVLDNFPSEIELGCILLDARIPGLSGPELQERLSEVGSTLPIIFLSGHSDIPITVQAIKAVGNSLGSTERTVKAHRHRVMEKMQVRSLAELISLAERVGCIGT